MENEKICFCCGEYDNPYKGHELYDSIGIPENFITVSWFGEDKTNDAHQECWHMEG